MFNLSLMTQFHEKWKISYFMFESIVRDIFVFKVKQCISENQHGFVKGRSTVTNLLEFTNFALRTIESIGCYIHGSS